MKATDRSLHTSPKKGVWEPSKAGFSDRSGSQGKGSLSGKRPEQTGSQSSRGASGLGRKTSSPACPTKAQRVQQEHPGPLQRWRWDAVFTAVSLLVLLNMGSQSVPRTRLSRSSPSHRVKVIVETRKREIYSVWPHWKID